MVQAAGEDFACDETAPKLILTITEVSMVVMPVPIENL